MCRRMAARSRTRRLLTILLVAGALALEACGGGPRCAPAPKNQPWEWALQAAYREYRGDDLLNLLRQRQRSGDPSIMFSMGLFVGAGIGDFPSPVERNHTTLILFKQAALCGYGNAIDILADIYERGDLGVAPNLDRARCLNPLRAGQPGKSAAECGIRLYEPNEITNPMWTPDAPRRRRGTR